MEHQMQPVVVKSFDGATRAVAVDAFTADRVIATRLGYAPTSQSWDGTRLTVIYERQAPTAPPPTPSTLGYHAAANARMNRARAQANALANQARADANALANRARARANASHLR